MWIITYHRINVNNYLSYDLKFEWSMIFWQGVKEIEEMWNNMKFTVVPYMKGTSMRGYILGAIDEIVQNLDDSSMNLQSMSASRFVGPFLNSVQNWEKSLSHISEVLDVSSIGLWNLSYHLSVTAVGLS